MKASLRASLALVGLALVFSIYSFADAGADFKAKCAMCHGPNGEGKAAMKTKDFGSAEVQKMSDGELAETIVKGKSPMPAFDGKLSKEQITDLVKWVRTLKK